jgi:hypothetical protein
MPTIPRGFPTETAIFLKFILFILCIMAKKRQGTAARANGRHDLTQTLIETGISHHRRLSCRQ